MASLKVVLRKKANKDGTYPLAIRVTKDRKTSFIHLGHHLHAKDWDASGEKVKKSHPNSVRFNHLILTKKAEANNTLLAMETDKKDVSSKVITKEIKPKEGISFFDQASIFISNMRTQGKYNRILTDQSRIKHFKEFVNQKDISFTEITVPLLNGFKAYLKGARGVSERTIVNHLILIRTIFNQAIAANIVDIKYYPFGKGKISIKIPDALKIGLSKEEVVKIEAMNLSDSPYLNHARRIWLISFYFAGMRISDVLRLKWSDFQNGRLHYSMGKNLKPGSLKVPEKTFALLEPYKSHEQKHDLVFPELKVLEELTDYEVQRKISYATKRINTALTEIAKHKDIKLTKPLSMHIARHTFGNIAGSTIALPILQNFFRHSNLATTAGYMKGFATDTADMALDSVVSF